MRYAGFWKRLWAYSIDAIILQIALFILFMLMPDAPESTTPESSLEQLVMMDPATGQEQINAMLAGLFDPVSLLIALGVVAMYNILFVASSWQATPGKRRYHMRVVTRDGARLGLIQSAVRHLACALSTLTAFLGFVMAAFHPEKAALHDVIAGTRVIYQEDV